MAARRRGKEFRSPFVAFEWEMMESAAFKRLSSEAVWIFAQIKRRFRSDRYPLSFRNVQWKMSFSTFDRGRRELIDGGFVVILERHGLDRMATVYGLSESWREISGKILSDPEAGRIVRRIRRVDGKSQIVEEWEPTKPTANAARRANWEKAQSALKRRESGIPAKRGKRFSDENEDADTPGKNSNRNHGAVNDNSPLIIHGAVDEKADYHSRGSEHIIHKAVNDKQSGRF
jgi:hypothetical protein